MTEISLSTDQGVREIGHRIQVFGNSCSGKSTLAQRIAAARSLPLVELDAINWQPNWVGLNATDPAEFESRIHTASSLSALSGRGAIR